MNIEKFDYSTNLTAVILWQYNEATNLLSLINQKQAWYDINQTQFWENWFNQVFYLGADNNQISFFGLAVWSIILDVPLFVPVAEVEQGVVWGFNDYVTSQTGTLNATVAVSGLSDTSVLSIGMGVFGTDIAPNTLIASIVDSTDITLTIAATGSGSETLYFYENGNLNFGDPVDPSLGAPFPPTTPVIYLSQPQQQFLLLLKYFNCTSRGTISYPGIPDTNFTKDNSANHVYTDNFLYNINYYLQWLCFNLGEAIGYGANTIVCIDNLDMTITYTFSTPDAFPSNLLQAITLLDLLPRPSGVAIV